jgi:quercetin dioxygenase-like cupin family protein
MTEVPNLSADVRSWADVPLLPPVPGLERRTVPATRSMLMRCAFDQGCVVPTHQHPQEQFTLILEGRLRFTVGEPGAEREFEAGAGDVVTVLPDVPHTAEALEPTISVDVFTPIREELLPEQA